jgi:hypothetical protein
MISFNNMRCLSCKNSSQLDIQCSSRQKKGSDYCGKHKTGKHVYKLVPEKPKQSAKQSPKQSAKQSTDDDDHTDVEDNDDDHTDVEDNDDDHTDVEDNDDDKTHEKNIILKLIQETVKVKFTPEFIKQFKTQKGNTQEVERNYISEIESILTELNLTYKKASSQGSKDFQDINNTGLNIEVKKTDSFNIMCNDTCPNEDIEYLIIFTGKIYAKLKDINPQLIFINGGLIKKDSPWIHELQDDLKFIKDKWCRGENKKKLEGILRTYIRPTYQFNIKSLLK